jgi:solute:Na+ symporter, SSS family
MDGFFNLFDYAVLAIYIMILIGIGFFLKEKASGSLEDYCLGGRNLPWWLMGISGMAAFLSLSGSMVIISFLYMLGPRGLYIAFRGGACIPLALMLIWSGKWHRRSGCITIAEFLEQHSRNQKDWYY